MKSVVVRCRQCQTKNRVSFEPRKQCVCENCGTPFRLPAELVVAPARSKPEVSVPRRQPSPQAVIARPVKKRKPSKRRPESRTYLVPGLILMIVVMGGLYWGMSRSSQSVTQASEKKTSSDSADSSSAPILSQEHPQEATLAEVGLEEQPVKELEPSHQNPPVQLAMNEATTPAAPAPVSTTPSPSSSSSLIADESGYRQIVAPFMKTYCLGCHGPETQEADFRVDAEFLKNNFSELAAKQRWGEIVNVLNSHEMPPESETQPDPKDVARVVDWITGQMVQAEALRRDSAIVLRRLNRQEYRNTIRDLFGIDFDVAAFMQDPLAGGFDNNGSALTISPLHLEIYYNAAHAILNRVLVEGKRPPVLRWRFQPESGHSDSNRVTYDKQRIIVNSGKPNRDEGDFVVVHTDSWDRKINVRDFQLPYEGEYIIRIRAAGTVPTRAEVVESARAILLERMEKQTVKQPDRVESHKRQMERDLEHFKTDRMYDYGPPRLKFVQSLGGQPHVITEFDVTAPVAKPRIYEIPLRFTTERAGFNVEYAYSIPKALENFWFQGNDEFARPELWVDWIEIEGPIYDSWPPSVHRNLISETISRKADERPAAKKILARFMKRAYRRPVTDREIDQKMQLFDLVREESPSFIEAMKTPLIAVLVSPQFLYLAEPAEITPEASAVASGRQLSDYELATRLSYFLWSSIPDETLLQLAESGQLKNPQVMSEQVERMLADSKSSAFVENFAGQWLGLREVGANPPAPDLYPRYDRHLELSIVGEPLAFFTEIMKNRLSVMNFVKSDFVVINERLGRFYGIPGVTGDTFQRVAVPEGVHRGGIVTQASMLTTTSNGTRTSPVKRGTWVMKNLLGIDPGLPVANVGEIAPKVPGIDKATVRQRLEIHRELPQCARCHNKIDPLGFALENFNAAGEWRDQEGFGYKGRISQNDPVIDASAKLIDGTEFVGVNGLRDVLTEKKELFLSCLTSKLLAYALGRELGIADQVHVKAAVAHLQQNEDSLPALIQFIVASEPFRTK